MSIISTTFLTGNTGGRGISQAGQTSYLEYNTYADLPSDAIKGEIALVLNPTGKIWSLDRKSPGLYLKGDSSWSYLGNNIKTVGKADVGLEQVDNTSDANKPISSATQTALDTKRHSIINIDSDYVQKKRQTGTYITRRSDGLVNKTVSWADRAKSTTVYS